MSFYEKLVFGFCFLLLPTNTALLELDNITRSKIWHACIFLVYRTIVYRGSVLVFAFLQHTHCHYPEVLHGPWSRIELVYQLVLADYGG